MIFAHTLTVLFLAIAGVALIAGSAYTLIMGVRLWLSGSAETRRVEAAKLAVRKEAARIRSKELTEELNRIFAMARKGSA